MGKTVKGKDKAKAKVAKAKAKIARKTKRGLAAVVAAFAFAILATGCASSESAQPAKSQTLTADFEDCTIIIAGKVSLPVAGTNQTITADGGELPTLELFTQTQSLESTGSTDTFSPTATQTPTTDVKPDITANYAQGGGITNRGTGGAATSGAAGIIEKLAARACRVEVRDCEQDQRHDHAPEERRHDDDRHLRGRHLHVGGRHEGDGGGLRVMFRL